MKLYRLGIPWLFLMLALLAKAQNLENYGGLLTQQVSSGKLPPPQHLQDHVDDGKLRLGVRDAVLLTLENNSNVRIQEAQVETDKFALLRTYQPFDPALQSIFNLNRFSSPGFSQLQGVGVSGTAALNSLTQAGQINYTQTFYTGTNIVVVSVLPGIRPTVRSTISIRITTPR